MGMPYRLPKVTGVVILAVTFTGAITMLFSAEAMAEADTLADSEGEPAQKAAWIGAVKTLQHTIANAPAEAKQGYFTPKNVNMNVSDMAKNGTSLQEPHLRPHGREMGR